LIAIIPAHSLNRLMKCGMPLGCWGRRTCHLMISWMWLAFLKSFPGGDSTFLFKDHSEQNSWWL
jgi:hypothetical protein